MENLTLASCSYNTPEVTLTMLRSFFKYHGDTKVLICENSSEEETADLLVKENVPFIRNQKGLHSPSVDILLDKCSTDYMLLVDTDIVFLKNHQDIFDQFVNMDLTLFGEVCGSRGGKSLYNRVHPWHCLINVKHINQHNIKFHDHIRLSDRTSPKIYDVGASFFEDIRKAGLKVGNAKLEDIYFKHYEGMSWRTKKFGNLDGNIDIDPTATHNNSEMLKYGQFIERIYQTEIPSYKDIKINAR